MPKRKAEVDDSESKKICTFVLKKKRRQCKFNCIAGSDFCIYHTTQPTDRKRVACPIDPNHTVWADELEAHIPKCPHARFVSRGQPYFEEDVNAGSDDGGPDGAGTPAHKKRLSAAEAPCTAEFIAKVNKLYDDYTHLIFNQDEPSSTHVPEEPTKTTKHTVQHVAITTHLKRIGLWPQHTSTENQASTNLDLTFVEFGAGKGGLSLHVRTEMTADKCSCKHLLVDRKNFRKKADAKAKAKSNKDAEADEADTTPAAFSRVYIDIKDLLLAKSPDVSKECVAISKHLCGCATDLTIRCIAHANKQPLSQLPSSADATSSSSSSSTATQPLAGHLHVKGLCIALCCHQLINWKSYVNKQYFIDNQFSQSDFENVVAHSGWAVCGPAREGKEDELTLVAAGTLKWSHQEKQLFGRKCKRVLDFGRLLYLKEQCGYNGVQLVEYVQPAYSLENFLLLAW
eukprot:TRINITY_DN64440_c1_g2_i1.p1 TRINITY_DN64440_c1_g2~~TRINITY_DN64440_c1_g2_i1.p1  ORF type:complete len:456 (-),score=43.90 TRINITY_DN64440_c1_g2_i1:47-1414(-)